MTLIIFVLLRTTIKESFKNYKKPLRYEYKHRKLNEINGVKGGPNWAYRNKTLTYNPYFSPNKSLKHMIAHMSHDALNGKLKDGPTLIDLGFLKKIKLPHIRLPPIIDI